MTMEFLLAFLVIAPGALFACLASGWLLGWTPREKFIARLTSILFTVESLAAFALGVHMWTTGVTEIRTPVLHWFAAGSYHFNLSLTADHLSWPLLQLTAVLSGLVGVFSVRYLHRDRGFFRFFLLLHLFAFGALLVLAAGTFDLLLGGWELVGLSSVLLIAFFDERREPVRNAIRVFGFYRIADLGLLLGIFVLHHFLENTEWSSLDQLSPSQAALAGLLLLMAAAGKSAQAPFSAWLPRAMEGPTPSSAIFYGAISVHLGAYLLLRSAPVFRISPVASGAVIAVGAITAILATLVHRASTDAKTSLAYAGMAQLGIIFIEIGLDYPMLALTHMMGHAAVRTLQFLRAPSMLHDYHRVHSAAGGDLGKTGIHYNHLLPEGARLWLYRAAAERGYQDALLDRLVTGPVTACARWLESLEPRGPHKLAKSPAERFAERVQS